MNMNIDQVYLDTLHEYLYCHRMSSEYGRYCYRVYRKIVRSHPHDHRAWDGLGQCCQYGYGTAPNLRRAKKYYKKAAKLGNAEAQQSLGWLYESAAEPDYRRARKWYAHALEQHSSDTPDAAYRLGYLYEKGLGGKKDIQTACQLYRKDAKAGHPDAQRALGYCYEKGLGLPENHAKARKWYARAALQADATACNNLGFLYHNGKGVRRSKKLAEKWYKLAARAGSILALSNLGVLYEDAGRLKKAVRYYRRAAEAGNKYAAKQLKRLDK